MHLVVLVLEGRLVEEGRLVVVEEHLVVEVQAEPVEEGAHLVEPVPSENICPL